MEETTQERWAWMAIPRRASLVRYLAGPLTLEGASAMCSFTCKQRILAALVVAGLAAAASTCSAVGRQNTTPPDIFANLARGVGLYGGRSVFGRLPGPPPS